MKATPLDLGPKRVSMSGKQLERLNRESIRLGFSRNLNLPPINAGMRFPIEEAWAHTSHKGEDNIRIAFIFATDRLGTGACTLTLDITPDAWAAIKK